MAFVIADRVRESTTTTGTGTITLAGAVSGFQSFSAGIGNGNSTYYTISDNVTNQWEVGIGTYTSAGSTLSRTTVLASSNAGSLVNFSTGTADVFVTYPSERAVYVNSANISVTVPALISTNDATISGLTVGKGGGAVSTNSAFGNIALTSNTSGTRNVALGYYSMIYNTTGGNNVGVGVTSVYSNTTGGNNTGVGDSALNANTTGSYNTAVGAGSLQANTTASNNTAVGYQAGYNNTTGAQNAIFGVQAGFANTTGAYNTFLGTYTGYTNTTGKNNVFIGSGDGGYGAGHLNTTGSSNVAIGSEALKSNTTANNNTAVGYQAGYSGVTAPRNTSIGYRAGYANTTGYNCFIGTTSGVASTGYGNTFVGADYANGCGALVTSGNNNTIIGGYSGNQGGLDIRTASNYIVLSDGDGNPRIYNDGTVNYFKSSDNSTSARIGVKNIQTISTTSTVITAGVTDYGQIVLVSGNDTGNIFSDLIFACTTAGATVLAAKSVSGSPVARTYTYVSGLLKLAMASGSYVTYCNQITNN